MRSCLAILLVLMAAAAEAEEAAWRNWFVGPNTGGGNHPMTVETEAEASAVFAGVTAMDSKGDEIRFGVRCYLGGPRGDNINSDDGVITSLFIGGILWGVEAPLILSGSFDGSQPIEIGWFGFNQGALVGNAKPQILAMLMQHEKLTITSDNATFSAKVSLDKASEAIAGVRCWGEL